MNKGVPEGTFRLEIEGVPTTEADLRAIKATLDLLLNESALVLPEGETRPWYQSQFFEQPYEQGGGYVVIYKAPIEDLGTNEFSEELEWRQAQGEWDPERYTGWCLVDWYTDSMTGVFQSPIMWNPSNESEVMLWEM